MDGDILASAMQQDRSLLFQYSRPTKRTTKHLLIGNMTNKLGFVRQIPKFATSEGRDHIALRRCDLHDVSIASYPESLRKLEAMNKHRLENFSFINLRSLALC